MKMIQLLKTWCWPTKSKVFLSSICFISGYLFHYFVPLCKKEDSFSLDKQYSSNVKDYNDISILLVVLIFSSVNNTNRRNTIRETWLSEISGNTKIKCYFVLSVGHISEHQKNLVSKEQEKHGDLLIFPNLEDSFYLLTPKLVASFGWLTGIPVLHDKGKSDTEKPFKTFKFLLKCDDDTFVRLSNVLQKLQTVYSGKKGENLYWGYFSGKGKPQTSGKYKEEQWNICDYYIPYALGGGYVLARPLVEFIARNGNFLVKYKFEDVSVGAWLSSYKGLNRVHDPRFDTEYISRGCHQSYLITHKHSEIAMRKFYYNLKTTGNLCEKEYKVRMSYIYNWKMAPSKCCYRINPSIP